MGDSERTIHDIEIEAIKSDMADIKLSMKELAKAVISIARSEERLANLYEMFNNLQDRFNKVEGRVRELESKAPINSRTNQWLERGMLLVVGAVMTKAITMVIGG